MGSLRKNHQYYRKNSWRKLPKKNDINAKLVDEMLKIYTVILISWIFNKTKIVYSERQYDEYFGISKKPIVIYDIDAGIVYFDHSIHGMIEKKLGIPCSLFFQLLSTKRIVVHKVPESIGNPLVDYMNRLRRERVGINLNKAIKLFQLGEKIENNHIILDTATGSFYMAKNIKNQFQELWRW